MNMIIVIYLVFCFKLSSSVPILLLTFDKQNTHTLRPPQSPNLY